MKKLFSKVFKSWLYIVIYFSILIVNVLLYWYFLFRELSVLGIILLVILSFFTSFFLLLFVEKRKVLFVVIVAILSIYLPYRSLGMDFQNYQLDSRSSLASYNDYYPLGPSSSTLSTGEFQYSFFVYAHDTAFEGLLYLNDYDSKVYSVDFKHNMVTTLDIDKTNKTYRYGYSYGMLYLVINDSTNPGNVEIKTYASSDLTKNKSDETFPGNVKCFFSNDYTLMYNLDTGTLFNLNRFLVATKLSTFDGSNGSYDLTSVSGIKSISMDNDQFIVSTDNQLYVFDSNYNFDKNISYSYTGYESVKPMQINGKFALVYNMGEGNYNIDYFNNYIMLETQKSYEFPVNTEMLYANSGIYDYFCFTNNMYIYYPYDQRYPVVEENTYPTILKTYAFSDSNGQFRIMKVDQGNGTTNLYLVNLGSFRYNTLADAAFYSNQDPADYFRGIFIKSIILEVAYISVLLASQYLVIKFINPVKDISTKEYFKKHFNSK